jgi:hypothetical protein
MRGDFEAIANFVRNEVAKHVAQYKFPRLAIVDQWDDKKHVAKVKLQPGDYLTGWLPIGGGIGAGKGRGFAHGLTKGDQVVVAFQEGSILTPVIQHRLWSDKDDPIKDVKSGEDHWVGLHKQWLKMLDKDKSLILRGYPGSDSDDEKDDKAAYQIFDKDGNIVRTIKKGALKADVQQGGIEWKHKGDAKFLPQSGAKVKVGQGQLLRVMLEDGTPSEILLAAKK